MVNKLMGKHLFLLLGVVLLSVTSLGEWTSLGDFKTRSGESAGLYALEAYDPELVKLTTTLDTLLQMAEEEIIVSSQTDFAKMEILFELVTKRLRHKEANHTFFSNWILFSLGQVHDVFLHAWDPSLIIKRGDVALCDQSSYLLLTLADHFNIRSRHVGLYGHVVMEAWYEDDWHLYDPDLEVIPKVDGEILSVNELIDDSEILREFYGKDDHVTEVFLSRENNTFVSYPVGARFEWKANMLAIVERVSEILKFVIPILMLLLTFLFRQKQTS